jgi:hypothetical protein
MNDSSPTYSLSDLKAKVDIGHYAITLKAAGDAGSMGMDEEDITDCIRALTKADFYKTMPSDKVPGRFQDVYKTHWCGKPIYAKLTLGFPGNKAVVVSFKRDQSQSPGENES